MQRDISSAADIDDRQKRQTIAIIQVPRAR